MEGVTPLDNSLIVIVRASNSAETVIESVTRLLTVIGQLRHLTPKRQ